jgi:hypothetical protein
MKIFFFFSLILICSSVGFSQNTEITRVRCAVNEHEAYLESQHANRKDERAAYENTIQQWITSNPDNNNRAVVTIPVVVHVVYKNAAENIPDAQILAQIKILNEDYSYTNADGSTTPAAFKSIAANAGIQFCMAKRDPNNKPTTGIIRKSTTVSGFSTDDKVKYASSGGDNAWDTKKYLNIWICYLTNGTLGYGEFPTGTQTNTYGLVCGYDVFGTPVADPYYNKGRTSTHEIGHCFNLRHIWGDEAGCSADDMITDTPQQKAEHYGKPNYPETVQRCNSSDPSSMFMNYMDYTDDSHMNMFTKGQSTRMNAVLSNPPYNALITSNGCVAPNPMDIGAENILLDNSLNIYPNPASQTISIEFVLQDNHSGSIELYNTIGQTMLTEKLPAMDSGKNSYSLDIAFLPRGLYFVTIKIENNTITKKISVI